MVKINILNSSSLGEGGLLSATSGPLAPHRDVDICIHVDNRVIMC